MKNGFKIFILYQICHQCTHFCFSRSCFYNTSLFNSKLNKIHKLHQTDTFLKSLSEFLSPSFLFLLTYLLKKSKHLPQSFLHSGFTWLSHHTASHFPSPVFPVSCFEIYKLWSDSQSTGLTRSLPRLLCKWGLIVSFMCACSFLIS